MENPAKNLQKRGKKMGQGSKKPDQENTVQQESFVILTMSIFFGYWFWVFIGSEFGWFLEIIFKIVQHMLEILLSSGSEILLKKIKLHICPYMWMK